MSMPVVIPETGGQNPYGCRSIPKSKRRLQIFVPRRDSRASLAPTRSADRNATIPVGTMDAPDFARISCKRRGRPLEGCLAVPNRVSRRQKFPWTSRALIEVAILDFRKPVGIGFELSFDLIAQSR